MDFVEFGEDFVQRFPLLDIEVTRTGTVLQHEIKGAVSEHAYCEAGWVGKEER